MRTRYVLPGDAGEEEAGLVLVLWAGLLSVQPVLERRPESHLGLQLAAHPDGDEPFLLLAVPDGPYLAVSPLTTAGEALLGRAIGPLLAWSEQGAATWANRQRWKPVIGLALRREADGGWDVYDPGEGH